MLHADVRIVKKDAPGPIFPEVGEAGFVEVLAETPWKVAVQEGAMASGRSSVDLAVEMPDAVPARYVLLRTSLSTLATIVTMARAAFPQEFVGTPLEADQDEDARQLAMAEALVQVTAALAQADQVDIHSMAHQVLDLAREKMQEKGG